MRILSSSAGCFTPVICTEKPRLQPLTCRAFRGGKSNAVVKTTVTVLTLPIFWKLLVWASIVSMSIVKRVLGSKISRVCVTLDVGSPPGVKLPLDCIAWRIGWTFET